MDGLDHSERQTNGENDNFLLIQNLVNILDLRNSAMIGSLTSSGSSVHLPGRGRSRLILPLAFGQVGSGHCV